MREVKFELLRPDEIEAARQKWNFVFLPLSPLEWHGPHLPFGFDGLNAYNMALELARRMGGVVLPCLYIGAAAIVNKEKLVNIGFRGDEYIVGRDYPGNTRSLYFHPEVFAIVLRNYLDLLLDLKYRAVIIVNTHGDKAHNDPIERLSQEYSNTTAMKVFPVRAMAKDEEQFPYKYKSDDPVLAEKYAGQPGHASKSETSLAMYYYPDRVDLNRLPPVGEPIKNTRWAITDTHTTHGKPTSDFSVCEQEDPRLSSTEDGHRLFELAIEQKAQEIEAFFISIDLRRQPPGDE